MILLTVVTGLVDVVAYLRLGHVFVANMTGNVVLLGFSAPGRRGSRLQDRCSRSPAFCWAATVRASCGRRRRSRSCWSAARSSSRRSPYRRVLAVMAMLLGALIGALLLLRVATVAPLILATGILAVVCISAGRGSSGP
jgi:uncharacterized membrane protein YoaK (UPF0700 family)